VLKKLQLKLADAYEICVAAEKVADMLVKFALGKEHIRAIGCEQGDIPAWDDLIIEQSDGTLEHIQIKRNFTKFSDDECDRDSDPVNKGKANERPRDLSPVDESLESLADWTLTNDPATSNPKRKFYIELPAAQILVKKNIEVRHVYEFCLSITQSTTAASLTQAATTHDPTKKIYIWLTTWCKFKDWDHILRAFRNLKIGLVGNEMQINQRTESMLAMCFSQPEEVRKKLNNFISENSTLTSSITPRPILGELKSFWLPELSIWTQYVNEGLTWDVGGISDPDFGHVERAAKVIDKTWGTDKKSELKIQCDAAKHEILPSALRRMVLHMPGTSSAYITNASLWQERTLTLIGGTLGNDEDDCEGLPIIEQTSVYKCADTRLLSSLDKAEEEGGFLNDHMDEATWHLIKKKLSAKITALPSGELRSSIEQRWTDWQGELNANPSARVNLCQQMLHPNAEGRSIISSLRHGPKTALLVAKGLLLLLAVTVAISDTNEGWQRIGTNLSVGTKALKFWSGPSDGDHSVRYIADNGIDILIGREPSKLLILSGVENSISETLETSLSDNNAPTYTLADGHQPLILITNSGKIKSALTKGSLVELKSSIQLLLTKATAIQQQQLNDIGL